MVTMWFPSMQSLAHIVIVGGAAYLALVALLRITGVRSLAKLNAFDFAVTVAIGSILASSVVSKSLSLGGAVVAMAMLLGAQYLMAVLIRRSARVRQVVTARPVLLVARGELREDAMRRARLGISEVYQAARSGGYGGLEEIGAMVMETDGTISIIGSSSVGSGRALDDIEGWAAGQSRP